MKTIIVKTVVAGALAAGSVLAGSSLASAAPVPADQCAAPLACRASWTETVETTALVHRLAVAEKAVLRADDVAALTAPASDSWGLLELWVGSGIAGFGAAGTAVAIAVRRNRRLVATAV